MDSDRILGIRANLWGTDSSYSSTVPTMVSPSELRMLEWLAHTMPLDGQTCIVDAGAFLGGSTRALAVGLTANSFSGDKRGLIHAYDIFKAPIDQYVQHFFGMNRPAGASVLDLFRRNIAAYKGLIKTHAGDFVGMSCPKSPIGLLFMDLAKSWELNEVAIHRYFGRLAPGAIVVQQDHNDQSCPWVNITMELLADHFEYLTDDGSSRVYALRSPVTMPSTPLRELSTARKLELIDRSASRSKDPVSAYLSATCKWLIHYEDEGSAPAAEFLESIRQSQPWESSENYVDRCVQSLGYVESKGGHDAYVSEYFGPVPTYKRAWSSLRSILGVKGSGTAA